MEQSLTQLPWTIYLLRLVYDEYKNPPPNYKSEVPTKDDMQYIFKMAYENDPFDKGGLKRESALAIQSGLTNIEKSACDYGEILLVSFKNSPFNPQWNTWWRAIRLLSPQKKVRILIFGHPRERTVPLASKLGPEHINGGAAMRCNPQTIVIYRKEEATRVLLHELFHASCSDPYSKETPYIEADTEAWAEILLCAMTAKGVPQTWVRHMREQISWAVKQASILQSKYRVYSSKDYAWRYLIGRLEVWRKLGINVPSIVQSNAKIQSLRFTICEPSNV